MFIGWIWNKKVQLPGSFGSPGFPLKTPISYAGQNSSNLFLEYPNFHNKPIRSVSLPSNSNYYNCNKTNVCIRMNEPILAVGLFI